MSDYLDELLGEIPEKAPSKVRPTAKRKAAAALSARVVEEGLPAEVKVLRECSRCDQWFSASGGTTRCPDCTY